MAARNLASGENEQNATNGNGVAKLALSYAECCRALGFSRTRLCQMVAAGTAPPSFLVGKRRLFPTEAVASWVRRQWQD